MKCWSCGRNIEDATKVCCFCGADPAGNLFNKENLTKPNAGNVSAINKQTTENTFYYNFIEPDEKLLATLGNGYTENILFGKVQKCQALLTNKRVYLEGKFFNGAGKKIEQELCEKIVDVDDVTGTGFIYTKPLGILFYGILTLILAILTFGIFFITDGHEIEGLVIMASDIIVIVPLVAYYLITRKTYFVIEYAGGVIKFDASVIGLDDVRDFQTQLCRAKDYVKRNRK